jgi:hypothetical protein
MTLARYFVIVALCLLGFQGVDNSGGALVGFYGWVDPAEDEGEPGDGEEGGGLAGVHVVLAQPNCIGDGGAGGAAGDGDRGVRFPVRRGRL